MGLGDAERVAGLACLLNRIWASTGRSVPVLSISRAHCVSALHVGSGGGPCPDLLDERRPARLAVGRVERPAELFSYVFDSPGVAWMYLPCGSRSASTTGHGCAPSAVYRPLRMNAGNSRSPRRRRCIAGKRPWVAHASQSLLWRLRSEGGGRCSCARGCGLAGSFHQGQLSARSRREQVFFHRAAIPATQHVSTPT